MNVCRPENLFRALRATGHCYVASKELLVDFDCCGSLCSNPLKRMPSAPSSKVDLMFRAFSDPIRLRILHLVQAEELCVCDLVAILKLPQPTVSRHLSYLRRAGLVDTREERSWNFYRLRPGRAAFHKKLLECLGSCFHDVPELGSDSKRAQKLRSRGGCCPP